MNEFELCKVKRISDCPKTYINEAAKLLTDVSLKWEDIPDQLQSDIDRWINSFVSGELKKWRER